MLRRIWQWLKGLFRRLFGTANQREGIKSQTSSRIGGNEGGREVAKPQPLADSDYEYLFRQLLEGVSHGWQQDRVLQWFETLKQRAPKAEWLAWLNRFGERVLESPAPNNELAARLVQVGEMIISIQSIREIGETAYNIGMQLLNRNPGEPIWEYGGPDASPQFIPDQAGEENAQQPEMETITLDELFARLQQDENLRLVIAQQLGIETTDPQELIQALINQFNPPDDNPTDVNPPDDNPPDDSTVRGGIAEVVAEKPQIPDELQIDLWSDTTIPRTPDLNTPAFVEWEEVHFDESGNIVTETSPQEVPTITVDNAESEQVEALFNQGIQQDNAGDWLAAIDSWDKALSIKSDLYEAWYNRGLALGKLEKFEEAIASFDKALEFKPDYHVAWYNRGVVLNKLGRFEEEIASYDKALEFKSDYYEAWINRGLAAGTSVSYNLLLASLSSIAKQNSALNQRGYQGVLVSYEEGLKYCQQETHPEGWGKLHHAIGQAHYFQGRQDLRPKTYCYKAINSYENALKTLTEQVYPEAHLEVLQDYIKVLLELGQTVEADELRRRGTDLLGRLLKETNRSDFSKQQLALKFVSFQQLTVDKSVKSGQLIEALEIAELGKNACLTWLLSGWNEEIASPSYGEIQQLLNPRTAIIYWHLSPAALTTFILKHNASEPILISTPTPSNLVGTQDLAPLPEIALNSLQHLHLFEDWVKDWNEQYTDYRHNTKDEYTKTNHSWRVGMKARLENLKNLLNIPVIEQQVKGIKQLILIPHRDLHIFPLHALFNPASADIPPFMAETEYVYEGERENFTITYLPSAQIGLNIQQRKSNLNNRLLSIENPTSEGLTSLEFARLESAIISQFFDNSKRIQSEQATKTQIENELAADYSIFHFAGHGSYNFTNPKQSALVLAANDKLTVAEIYQKSLKNYNLVSLSACETYLTGKQTITNEYVGLISSFLSRGVGNVVSTQWTVESKATALLMIEFYKRRQPDKSEAKALAEAIHWLKELTVQQLKETYESLLQYLPADELQINAFLDTEVYRLGKMNSDQKLYEHPYYWAAFTHTGKHC